MRLKRLYSLQYLLDMIIFKRSSYWKLTYELDGRWEVAKHRLRPMVRYRDLKVAYITAFKYIGKVRSDVKYVFDVVPFKNRELCADRSVSEI